MAQTNLTSTTEEQQFQREPLELSEEAQQMLKEAGEQVAQFMVDAITEEKQAKICSMDVAYGGPMEKGQSPFDMEPFQKVHGHCTEECEGCSHKCDVAETMGQRDRKTKIAADLKLLLKFHNASVEEVMNVLKTL